MIARLTTFDYFNPLPRKEGDDVCKTGCKKAHDFNPLPRKEGDIASPNVQSPES